MSDDHDNVAERRKRGEAVLDAIRKKQARSLQRAAQRDRHDRTDEEIIAEYERHMKERKA